MVTVGAAPRCTRPPSISAVAPCGNYGLRARQPREHVSRHLTCRRCTHSSSYLVCRCWGVIAPAWTPDGARFVEVSPPNTQRLDHMKSQAE